MLSSFLIRNYRSILELKLDFTYGEGKAPNGYKEQAILPFIESETKHRVVPCMAFFGANASGKTNILKAFGTFRQLLLSKDEILSEVFEPNLLNPRFSETTFAIEFFIESELFEYRISYDANMILEETLNKNEKRLYSIENLKADFSTQIVSDSYSNEKLSDILRVECSNGEGSQTKPFLNRIATGYPGLNRSIKNAFSYFKERLILYTNTNSIPIPVAVDILSSSFGGDKNAALKEITDIVRRLDIEITTIDILQKELAPDENNEGGITRVDQQTGSQHAVKITSTHKDVFGSPTIFDFMKQESAGTQRLAGLIGLILHTLRKGGVLLVDELECSLHPLLIREILMLFKLRRHNPNRAQLIFSTHNTDILDDSVLRISEIALVKKNVNNGTLMLRLVDAKNNGDDIRNVTNFRRQYLAGYYSGIPHPAL